MSSHATTSHPVERAAPGPWLFGLAAVFGVAFLARLIPLLRGGGLHAIGNYDDGVHYAAAMGLMHGLMPYRDFLLLHPPGVPIVLSPFAALAGLVGEPDAVAVARLSWMALGGLNAVLCALVISQLNRMAGIVTGLMYAVFFGAIYLEHTVLLEPPATAVMLAALVLTRALGDDDGIKTRHYVIAGVLLGLSPTMKIWGVVAVLVVAGGLAYRRGLRRGLTVLLSAIASCAVIYLPFFLSAPKAMWQMVVTDQLGRGRGGVGMVKRLDDSLGLTRWTDEPRLHWGTALVAALVLASLAVCVVQPRLRVVAALFLTQGALLAVAPIWFLHYAGWAAPPVVLTLGAGLAALLDRAESFDPRLPRALATLAAVAVAVYALPLTQLALGRPFPGREAAQAVADVDGCVASDWPMALAQMDLLGQNLERGCRHVVDLSGVGYHVGIPGQKGRTRSRNEAWQAYALDYLRTGEVSILVRSPPQLGLSAQSTELVRSWPKVKRVGRYTIRQPQP